MTLFRKFVSPSVVALALVLAAGAPAAMAQGGKPPAAAPGTAVSKEILGPINEGLNAIKAKDYATAKIKLDAASAGAKTPQDHYQIEKLRIAIASDTKDFNGLITAMNAAMATNLATPEEIKAYKFGFVTAYAGLNDNVKTVAALRSYVDAYGGTDVQLLAIGQELVKAKDAAGVGYVEKGIAAIKAAGGKPTEPQLRLLMRAYVDPSEPEKYRLALEELITTYPKDDYWREYVASAQKAPGFKDATADVRLDIYRGLLGAGLKLTLQQANDMANDAMNRGLPGEAVAALEPLSAELDANGKSTLATATKQVKAEKLDLAKQQKEAAKGTAEQMASFGEAALGYGEYATATDSLKAALAKGIANPGKADIARLHLGIAQYRAGQKDAAQATWAEIKSDNGTAVLGKVWTLISKTKG